MKRADTLLCVSALIIAVLQKKRLFYIKGKSLFDITLIFRPG